MNGVESHSDDEIDRLLVEHQRPTHIIEDAEVTAASVYNPSVREFGCDAHANALLLDPTCVFGSQAFLISKPAVEYVVRHWNAVRGMQDAPDKFVRSS